MPTARRTLAARADRAHARARAHTEPMPRALWLVAAHAAEAALGVPDTHPAAAVLANRAARAWREAEATPLLRSVADLPDDGAADEHADAPYA